MWWFYLLAIVEHVRDGCTVRVFLLPSFHHLTIMLTGIKVRYRTVNINSMSIMKPIQRGSMEKWGSLNTYPHLPPPYPSLLPPASISSPLFPQISSPSSSLLLVTLFLPPCLSFFILPFLPLLLSPSLHSPFYSILTPHSPSFPYFISSYPPFLHLPPPPFFLPSSTFLLHPSSPYPFPSFLSY